MAELAKFVYQPEGVEPKVWPLDPAKLMSPECEAIERVTKMTYAEWGDAISRGSMTAIHALLWVLLKREQPTLAYDDVQFSLADIDFVADVEDADPND